MCPILFGRPGNAFVGERQRRPDQSRGSWRAHLGEKSGTIIRNGRSSVVTMGLCIVLAISAFERFGP